MFELTSILSPAIIGVLWCILTITQRRMGLTSYLFLLSMFSLILSSYLYATLQSDRDVAVYGYMYRATVQLLSLTSLLYIRVVIVGRISKKESYAACLLMLISLPIPSRFYLIYISLFYLIAALYLFKTFKLNSSKEWRSNSREVMLTIQIATISVIASILALLHQYGSPPNRIVNILLCTLQSFATLHQGEIELLFKDSIIKPRLLLNPVKHISDMQMQDISDDDIAYILNNESTQKLRSLQEIHERFTTLMTHNRYYLNAGITIDDVAREVGTNRVYLSRILNQIYHQTFPEYINTRRIAYAKQLLVENRDRTLEMIATTSGFYSTTQFNRKFKEITGVSPRRWQIAKTSSIYNQ